MSAQDLEQRAHELLPCPWCGGTITGQVSEGSTFRWRKVDGCCADGPEVRHDTMANDQKAAEADSHQRAIEAWNTRANQPAPLDLEQFREAVECWRDAALPANDVEAERKAEADRLLSIIDNAGKVAHQPAPVVDEWCRDYHCAGDCGMRGHGWQHSPVGDDARMARALEWVRAECGFYNNAEARTHLHAIEEALAAYDPNCGARTVRVVDDAMVEWKPRNRTEAAALAKIALAHLGVVDAYIDNAIARMETDAALARAQGVKL